MEQHGSDSLGDAGARTGTLVSHYRVLERMGGGGMGVVYRALDTKLQRDVALKFLPPELSADTDANARFMQEARAASALDHPNICTIYEIGEGADGSRFIAMACYTGSTLEAMVAAGPLPVPTAVKLALQMADGLARAHEAGIVHRDIKPGNVMVTERGLVKLLDFGIAKLSGVQLTRTGTMMGTMAYMSPEQMSGEAVDHRADIWALGVVLYEMLAGQRPFTAGHEVAMLYAVLNTDPKPLADVRSGIPDGLARVIGKCLRRRPEDRYQDLDAVIADLRAFLPTGDPVSSQIWLDAHRSDRVRVRTRPVRPVSPAIATTPSSQARDRANQLVLMQKVRQFWIEGVLEQSIHRATLIELGKETRPDAVAHPWEQVLELPDHTCRTLPPGHGIGSVFAEVGHSLLILGAPGAGKTITLLDLARDLIARAESDETQPIPVVLNLSSWTDARQPLIAWIAEEMSAKYQIPKRMARAWLEENRLTLLLDGLDEVMVENRRACVETINAFLEQYGAPGMAVCSRVEDYTALPVRLALYAAICLRPLSAEQVQRHVAAGGPALTGLATALRSNSVLLSMAQTPLMLDVMTMAYRDVSGETLARQSAESWEVQRDRLFKTYVDRMFQRRSKTAQAYSKEQTLSWLSWLARGMRQRGQTVFLIEQLQPSWLATRAQRWLYATGTRITTALFVAVLYGLISGIVVSLLEAFRTNPDGTVRMGPILALFFGTGPMLDVIEAPLSGLAFGTGAGLALGLIDGVRIDRQRRDAREQRSRSLRRTFLYAVWIAACVALAGGLGVALFWGPLEGLEVGLFFGSLFGVIWGTRDYGSNPMNDIHTVEALRWSAKKARLGALVGLLVGMILGQSLGVLFAIVKNEPIQLERILPIGVVWGFSFAVIGLFFGGLDSDLVKGKTITNQGIALSKRNAIYVGWVFGAIASLCQGLMTWPFEGPFAGVLIGVLLGGILGVSAGMWYGGLDVFHHYALRVLLHRRGHMPLRYADFLDHAHHLIFLQKVGGGVIFIHRLLLEYFAGLDECEKAA